MTSTASGTEAPDSRKSYEFGPPENFLGLPAPQSEFETSRAMILPVPFEATTSYGGGTRNGPRAIIEASAQVELYDIELGREPAMEWGVHTLPYLAPSLHSLEDAVADIAAAVADLPCRDKLLCVLGGEHTVSVGVARGLREHFGPFLTVQIDAHADLRDSYEGTPYSHASAMRRVLELGGPLLQLGIRSLDRSEAEFLAENPDTVTCFTAAAMRDGADWRAALTSAVSKMPVFLTIDVDGLDPSVIPATGTPEPGGLGWYDVLEIVRLIARHGRVIAFDCVELAPIPGLHHPNFTTAKLIYKTMTEIMEGR